MGGGIAQLAADKGLPARMKDIEPKALAHGFAAAAAVWREKAKKKKTKGVAGPEMAAKMALLSGTLDYTGFRTVRSDDRGRRREARRQTLRPQGVGGRGARLRDLRLEYVDAADRGDRRGRAAPVAGRRNALLQPRAPDAARRGDPRARDVGRDGRDHLRPREDARQDSRRGQGLAGLSGQPHPRPLPLGGRAPRPGRLSHRSRRRR